MALARLAEKVWVRMLYINRIGPWLSRIQSRDDFSWDNYTWSSYAPSLTEFSKKFTARLTDTEWSVQAGKISTRERPLHPNHQLIYELALQLRPQSIFECGFGAGDHLANLALLMPTTLVGGADISQKQLELALYRNTSLRSANLYVRDLTEADAVADLAGTAEFVFCQAVLMHIHGGQRHVQFLHNMWNISKRYVFLVENWLRHDFVADLQGLFPNAVLYRVSTSYSSGLLLDKCNAADFPVVASDAKMRSQHRIG